MADCFVSRTLPSTTRRSKYRRSEEHTSELQSRLHLVCRLLLEKKTNQIVPLYNPKTAALSPHVYAAHINLIVSLTCIMLLQALIPVSGVIVNSVLNVR